MISERYLKKFKKIKFVERTVSDDETVSWNPVSSFVSQNPEFVSLNPFFPTKYTAQCQIEVKIGRGLRHCISYFTLFHDSVVMMW
jgi:hypothetical protein